MAPDGVNASVYRIASVCVSCSALLDSNIAMNLDVSVLSIASI